MCRWDHCCRICSGNIKPKQSGMSWLPGYFQKWLREQHLEQHSCQPCPITNLSSAFQLKPGHCLWEQGPKLLCPNEFLILTNFSDFLLRAVQLSLQWGFLSLKRTLTFVHFLLPWLVFLLHSTHIYILHINIKIHLQIFFSYSFSYPWNGNSTEA